MPNTIQHVQFSDRLAHTHALAAVLPQPPQSTKHHRTQQQQHQYTTLQPAHPRPDHTATHWSRMREGDPAVRPLRSYGGPNWAEFALVGCVASQGGPPGVGDTPAKRPRHPAVAAAALHHTTTSTPQATPHCQALELTNRNLAPKTNHNLAPRSVAQHRPTCYGRVCGVPHWPAWHTGSTLQAAPHRQKWS